MATYSYAVVSPIAMPSKSPYYHPAPANRTYAVSPPETADSVTSGSGIAPSYTASGYSTTSSYAGSEYESRNSANGIDLQEYVSERFSNMSFDPLPLDRSLATQAQAYVLPLLSRVVARLPLDSVHPTPFRSFRSPESHSTKVRLCEQPKKTPHLQFICRLLELGNCKNHKADNVLDPENSTTSSARSKSCAQRHRLGLPSRDRACSRASRMRRR